MKKLSTRLVALVLAVSLSLSVFAVPSFAADAGTVAAGDALLQYIIANYGSVEDSIRTAATEFTWDWVGPLDADGLMSVVNSYNAPNGRWRGDLYNTNPVYQAYTDFIDKMCGADTSVPHDLFATIELDPTHGNVYRPRLRGTGGNGRPGNGAWLEDKNGDYPCCSQAEWEASPYFSGNPSGGNVPAMDGVFNPYRNKWVPSEDVNFKSGVIATKDALASALIDIGRGELWAVQLGRGKYYVLYDKVNDEFWCNNNKQCWMAPLSNDNVIINQKLDYIIDKVDTPEPTPTPEPTATPGPTPTPAPGGDDTDIWNGSLIDLSNSKFSLVDELGSLLELNIDNVTFDFSTKNYTVNCFDIDYNYYTYNVQYPTNPGSYFYGNSGSGDFIAGPAVKSQLQPTGIDYPRFVWTKGASISYMDSNAFNGALYLDETEHEFKINLPKTLGRDFSVYFRYYQNSSKDTNHIDNYISSNGNKLLSWSEQHMYAPDGHQLTTPLSVGSWQEIALFRKGHDLHIYHNGIKVETVSLTAALSDSLVFHLGANSRAYSMLDEIRVLDFPRTTWKSYTPTVVPMDTNEVLVLPGTNVQVSGLDTYYNNSVVNSMSIYSKFDGLDYEGNNYDTVFQFNNYVCYDEDNGDYAWFRPEGVDRSDLYCANSGPGHGPFDNYTFTYEPIMVTAGEGGQSIGSSSEGVISFPSVVPSVILNSEGDFYLSDPTAAPLYLWGVKTKVSRDDWSYLGCYYDNTVSSYFNVVFDDYSVAHVPVTWGGDGNSQKTFVATSSTGKTAHIQFVTKGSNYWSTYEGAYLQYYTVYDSAPIRMFWIGDQSAVDVSIIHNYYNSATESIAANTAALQTDIPIRSYLVGGVRPIFPELGDVWMMVEGRRISGVQIYNGRAWEAVEARWWTGTRWIPIYAFDIVTLADMWDVTGSDGKPVAPTITTESGFWNWWKNQWLDFRDWLKSAFDKVNPNITFTPTEIPGGGSGSGGGADDGSWSFTDLLKGLKDAVWGIVKGIVDTIFGGILNNIGDGIKDFFKVFKYEDSKPTFDPDNIFGIVSYGGDDIWD